MTYAYLQLARDGDARRVMEETAAVTGFTSHAGPYGQAAIPARYAIERGDWKRAVTLEPRTSKFPYTAALTHFARALAAARSGDKAKAKRYFARLVELAGQGTARPELAQARAFLAANP